MNAISKVIDEIIAVPCNMRLTGLSFDAIVEDDNFETIKSKLEAAGFCIRINYSISGNISITALHRKTDKED